MKDKINKLDNLNIEQLNDAIMIIAEKMGTSRISGQAEYPVHMLN